MTTRTRFADRREAGRELARHLLRYRDESPVVLGLPRGGVLVAYEVARALGAPLDVWVVRKVGAPTQPELGLGAVAEGGEVYVDEYIARAVGASDEQVQAIVRVKAAEVEARQERLRNGRPPPRVAGRTVIVVDDGIATGGTVRAALRALRRLGSRRLVLAAPVAAEDTLEAIRAEADDVVCPSPQAELYSVGTWYDDFRPVRDEDVIALLERARADASVHRAEHIDDGTVELSGDLSVPAGATGLVLFAHGSGSSRKSPRNRFVASALQRAGLATLLFDLLTEEEEAADIAGARLRFDVDFLARRLADATRWARRQPETRDLRLGYFGASTGAAAAVIAAVECADDVSAIVSRGGRPDLASDWLGRVRAPTLLVVGAEDTEVLGLNRTAFDRLTCKKALSVVPRATHLFEEPGALEEAARLATEWFVRHLAPAASLPRAAS